MGRRRLSFCGLLMSMSLCTFGVAQAADYFGDGNPNTIVGTPASDTIWSYGGDDNISGGAGDDKLYGGSGSDQISGDDGDDLIFGETYSNESQDNSPTEVIHGGNGDDTIFAGYTDVGVEYSTTAFGQTFVRAMNEVYGDAGNDTLLGGPRIDDLFGGNGNDGLHGYGGDDALQGNLGDDTLFGYEGNDFLDTGPGSDVALGGPGNDRIGVQSGGVSAAYGEDGDDVIWINDALDSKGLGVVYGFGGAGKDSLTSTSTGQNVLLGGDGDDQIKGSDQSAVDALYGDGGADVLSGGGGIDYLFGGEGNDKLDAGSDAVTDVLLGGDGNDYLSASGESTEVFYGDAGNDVINTGPGADYVYPGSGANVIYTEGVTIVVNGGEGSSLELRTRQPASSAVWQSVVGYDLLSIGTEAIYFVGVTPNRSTVSIINPSRTLIDGGKTVNLLGGGRYTVTVVEAWNGETPVQVADVVVTCLVGGVVCPSSPFFFMKSGFTSPTLLTLRAEADATTVVRQTFLLKVSVAGQAVGDVTVKVVRPEDLHVGDVIATSTVDPFGKRTLQIGPDFDGPYWFPVGTTTGGLASDPNINLTELTSADASKRYRIDALVWTLGGISALRPYGVNYIYDKWNVGVSANGAFGV